MRPGGPRALERLIQRMEDLLLGKPPPVIVIPAVAAILTLGYLDYRLGSELGLEMLDLVSVLTVARFVGTRAGLAVAAIATIVWAGSDLASGHADSYAWVVPWQSAMRFGMFALFAVLVGRLKTMASLQSALARTDPLTGAENSRSFTESADVELERARRFGRPLTLAYLDVDGFKAVNDDRGHSAGDELLRLVAGVLKDTSRATDTVARLGGDEFAVLLPETGGEGGRLAAERLRAELDAAVRDGGYPVSFSVGAITFQSPPASVDDMVRFADQLMYAVKHSGKDAVEHKVVGRPGSGAG